jgi:uncharacterized protein YndB with AHSA1/START domain
MSGISVIKIYQQLEVSSDILWEYLTEPTHMKKWWFSKIRNFEPIEGFQTRFTVTHKDEKYVHLWEVLEIVQCKKLKLDWQYANYPGKAYALFELEKNSIGTLLTFTSDVLEFFPNQPSFSRNNVLKGWETLIKKKLPNYINENS